MAGYFVNEPGIILPPRKFEPRPAHTTVGSIDKLGGGLEDFGLEDQKVAIFRAIQQTKGTVANFLTALNESGGDWEVALKRLQTECGTK